MFLLGGSRGFGGVQGGSRRLVGAGGSPGFSMTPRSSFSIRSWDRSSFCFLRVSWGEIGVSGGIWGAKGEVWGVREDLGCQRILGEVMEQVLKVWGKKMGCG